MASLCGASEVANPMTTTPFARQAFALAPVSADGQVVAVDVTGRVYAFDAATGVPTGSGAQRCVDPRPARAHGRPGLGSRELRDAVRRGPGVRSPRLTVETGETLLRGLADGGDALVAVAGFEILGSWRSARSERRADRRAVSDDVERRRAAGRARARAIPARIAAVALTRPLQRRLWGSTGPADTLEEEVDG